METKKKGERLRGFDNGSSRRRDINFADREDFLLKFLLDVAGSLEALSKQIRETVTPIVEEKVREKEGFTTFEFLEPLRRGKGFEGFLLRVLEGEKAKHKDFVYVIERNQGGEIVKVSVKGPREHLEHVSKVVDWINGKISEKRGKGF